MVTSVDLTRRWILIVYKINFVNGGWISGEIDLEYSKTKNIFILLNFYYDLVKYFRIRKKF